MSYYKTGWFDPQTAAINNALTAIPDPLTIGTINVDNLDVFEKAIIEPGKPINFESETGNDIVLSRTADDTLDLSSTDDFNFQTKSIKTDSIGESTDDAGVTFNQTARFKSDSDIALDIYNGVNRTFRYDRDGTMGWVHSGDIVGSLKCDTAGKLIVRKNVDESSGELQSGTVLTSTINEIGSNGVTVEGVNMKDKSITIVTEDDQNVDLIIGKGSDRIRYKITNYGGMLWSPNESAAVPDVTLYRDAANQLHIAKMNPDGTEDADDATLTLGNLKVNHITDLSDEAVWINDIGMYGGPSEDHTTVRTDAVQIKWIYPMTDKISLYGPVSIEDAFPEVLTGGPLTAKEIKTTSVVERNEGEGFELGTTITVKDNMMELRGLDGENAIMVVGKQGSIDRYTLMNYGGMRLKDNTGTINGELWMDSVDGALWWFGGNEAAKTPGTFKTNTISADTIGEFSDGSGVTIQGIKINDNTIGINGSTYQPVEYYGQKLRLNDTTAGNHTVFEIKENGDSKFHLTNYGSTIFEHSTGKQCEMRWDDTSGAAELKIMQGSIAGGSGTSYDAKLAVGEVKTAVMSELVGNAGVSIQDTVFKSSGNMFGNIAYLNTLSTEDVDTTITLQCNLEVSNSGGGFNISNTKLPSEDPHLANKKYVDDEVTGAISTANGYTDTEVSGAVSTANSYTDTQIGGLPSVSSSTYTDSAFTFFNSPSTPALVTTTVKCKKITVGGISQTTVEIEPFTADSSEGYFDSNTLIPAEYRPTSEKYFFLRVGTSGFSFETPGWIEINPSGRITYYPGTNYTGDAAVGPSYPQSFTY